MDCFDGFFGPKIEFGTPVEFVQDSEMAGIDAACKLMQNCDKVVFDICNPGPNNIYGKTLTQTHLKRVDPKDTRHVQEMIKAACRRLLGKETSGASTKDEALVWANAAWFLGVRVQGSDREMPGRAPDMSAAQAEAMKTVLGQIEAASKLMNNREVVCKDIINSGSTGVYGGMLTQRGLQRLDPKHRDIVNDMLREVTARLLGKKAQIPSGDEKVKVWADAASFFGSRIQSADSADNPREHSNRKNDMSRAAAGALKTVLGQLEAAHRLMSNRDTVVRDITNSGPDAVNGGRITQKELKRVNPQYKAAVAEMIKAVCSHLHGQDVNLPAKPEEALAWAEAASYLHGRVQASDRDCPGRARDMSLHAAKAMRTSLAQLEAASKLKSNRQTVVQDICNSGRKGVNGGGLTQTALKRVDPAQTAKVDAMIGELCDRLSGKKLTGPPTSQDAQVWAQAATYFSQRIQASAREQIGRNPDMSKGAAVAMRAVLSTIITKKKENLKEAAEMLAH
jgi:hypothetical protein